MTYTAELRDMNARLPARKRQLLVRRSMDRVIEPFRVGARATVGGGIDDPGVVLAMEVMPGVKGVISPDKIHDLYRVLDYVSKAAFLSPTAAAVGSGGGAPSGGGMDTGVERMGVGGELVVIDERDPGGRNEPLVLWQWLLKVPTIALLLVEPDKDPANTNDGLLAAVSGACPPPPPGRCLLHEENCDSSSEQHAFGQLFCGARHLELTLLSVWSLQIGKLIMVLLRELRCAPC